MRRDPIMQGYWMFRISSMPGLCIAQGTEYTWIWLDHALWQGYIVCRVYMRELYGLYASVTCSIITSPQNQSIESYWWVLQRDRLEWWRRFFQNLVDLELLNTDDPVVLNCIYYCFMWIIRDELNSVKEGWNSRNISRSHKSGPTDPPSCMYHLPHKG